MDFCFNWNIIDTKKNRISESAADLLGIQTRHFLRGLLFSALDVCFKENSDSLNLSHFKNSSKIAERQNVTRAFLNKQTVITFSKTAYTPCNLCRSGKECKCCFCVIRKHSDSRSEPAVESKTNLSATLKKDAESFISFFDTYRNVELAGAFLNEQISLMNQSSRDRLNIWNRYGKQHSVYLLDRKTLARIFSAFLVKEEISEPELAMIMEKLVKPELLFRIYTAHSLNLFPIFNSNEVMDQLQIVKKGERKVFPSRKISRKRKAKLKETKTEIIEVFEIDCVEVFMKRRKTLEKNAGACLSSEVKCSRLDFNVDKLVKKKTPSSLLNPLFYFI